MRAREAGGPRSHAVPALVQPGRHARRARCAAPTTRRRATYTLDVAQRTPADARASRRRSRSTFRSRVGLVGPGRRATCRCALDGERRGGTGTTRVLSRHAAAADVPLRRRAGAARAVAAARILGAGARSSSTTRDAELAFLAAHDSDPVNRWDAAQRSFCDAILALARGARARRAAGARPDRSTRSSRRSARRPRRRSRAARAGADAARTSPISRDWSRRSTSTRWSRRATSSCASSRRAARAALEHAFALASRRARRTRRRRRRSARACCATRACAISARSTTPPARALAVAQYDAADNMTDAIAALAAVNHSVGARARGAVRALRGEVARRAAGARQVVRAAGDLAARRTRSRACAALLAHPKFNARNPTACARWSATFALRNWRALPRRRRRGLRVRRRPDPGASTAAIRSSRRRSPARSTSGGASPSRAGRCSGRRWSDRPRAGAVARRRRNRRAQSRGLTLAPRAARNVARHRRHRNRPG